MADARIPIEIVRSFRNLGSASIHEAMGGRGAVSPAIKSLTMEFVVCGRVFTVEHPGNDNYGLHQALAESHPGDVIVARTNPFAEAAGWGEITTVAAELRGVAGFVTDGYVRDTQRIVQRKFPVFCRGVCIKGTSKTVPGGLGRPVVVGGILVEPGDLIVGDADGLVVVPCREAEEVLHKTRERENYEQKILQELQAGRTTLEALGLTCVSRKVN